LVIIFGPSGTSCLNNIENSFSNDREKFIVIPKQNYCDMDSWLKATQELRQSERTLVIFTSVLGDCKHLLSICKHIFYIHVSEERLFAESMMNNKITYEAYKHKIWPTYSTNAKQFLEHTDNNLRRVLINSQALIENTNKSLKQLCDFLNIFLIVDIYLMI
jgi:hypothetical protein